MIWKINDVKGNCMLNGHEKSRRPDFLNQYWASFGPICFNALNISTICTLKYVRGLEL